MPPGPRRKPQNETPVQQMLVAAGQPGYID
jgi:hypothetical protein